MLIIINEFKLRKHCHKAFQIDYSKEFESTTQKLLKILGKFELRVMHNLYWEQFAWRKMFTEYMKIRKEPGCVFSMDLFKIYSKIILKGLENLPGFIISKHNLSNI